MKKRFLVRVILFVIFAILVGIVLLSENFDKASKAEETITDNYYNNFFGLVDGIAEVRNVLKRKIIELVDFVEVKH